MKHICVYKKELKLEKYIYIPNSTQLYTKTVFIVVLLLVTFYNHYGSY